MATRKEITITRRAMACDFSLTFPAEERCALEAGCAALDEVERVEAKLSAYRQDSELTYMNRHAWETPVVVDQELFSVLTTSARLAAITGGAFDPAAGALIKAWGFFRPPRRVPSDAERQAALASCGMARVELDCLRRRVRYLCPDLEINLGGVGKGYAIDRAIESAGARAVLVEGGQSSLRALGRWRVAIGDPFRPARAMAMVRLRDRALGTSAATHQHFFQGGRRYGHVLDPRTGWPAGTLASATAMAPTAAEADALSTAFFVMGVEGTRRYCREHRDIAAVLLTKPEPGRVPQLTVIGPADVEMLQ
jgi:thiamine biosynthesis lipoprotein